MVRRLLLTFSVVLVAFSGSLAFAEKASVRMVTGGQVQGIVASDSDYPGQDLEIYKNIPYAAPPQGALRWRAPQPVVPWDGVRATEEYGAVCPQTAELAGVLDTMVQGQGMSWWREKLISFLIGFAPQHAQSEDCLSINVWTEKGAGKGDKKPVMVWIHGGGHIAGSAAYGLYEGDVLARKGVVFVSMNYRLGILGFMAHPELSAEAEQLEGVRSSGNYGTLDQIAALKWVQNNIEQFGGDPDQVTIFGESAGGHSVGQIMASPLARGTFHRAIAQSGLGSHNYLHLTKPMGVLLPAEQGGMLIGEAAGIAASNESNLAKLRDVSVEQLLAITTEQIDLMSFYHPNVDGWVLPKPVASVFAAGEQADVPLLLGSNADEGLLFRIFDMPPLFWRTDLPTTTAGFNNLLSEEFGAADAQLLMAHYHIKTDADVPDGRLNIWGDSYFGYQSYWGAHAMKNVSSPAYLYFFTRTPPSPTQTLGATHSTEIPFVFGGTMPLFPTNDFDDSLVAAMSTYWVNFAKTGLPIGRGLPAWPQFTAQQNEWMVFGEQVGVAKVERTQLYSIYGARQQQLHEYVETELGLRAPIDIEAELQGEPEAQAQANSL